jgi:hypothetical protein
MIVPVMCPQLATTRVENPSGPLLLAGVARLLRGGPSPNS